MTFYKSVIERNRNIDNGEELNNEDDRARNVLCEEFVEEPLVDDLL